MVKIGAILNAVKSVLDADSTLDTLLGVTDGISKVILGIEMPGDACPPVINITEMSENTLNPDYNTTSIVLGFIVRVPTKEYDRIDYDTIDSIGQRLDALLNRQALSLSSGYIKDVSPESSLPATPDFGMDSVSLKQFRYRILASD